MTKELNVHDNIIELLDRYIIFVNGHRKLLENEQDSQFDEYRNTSEEGRLKCINIT